MLQQRCHQATTWALGVAVLLALSVGAALATLTFPQLSGRVVDDAGVLDGATKANLDRKLADFEAKSTGQLVVVSVRSLQGTSIEDYGYQLGRHWGIGQKDKNSGALLIVAPNERKVRIEVGYGLEGTLTDAVSKLIIESSILPRFRAGDFAGGITRGVDDIIQVLSGDAEEWKQRATKRPETQSGNWDILLLIFFGLMLLIILRNAGGGGQRGGRYGRRGPIFFPLPSSGASWGSGGSWSGSSGGFSGGGGSFGGGGASGSW
ncbi:MAG: TPM domain-containing protein [Xanthobacteraceae bacterium]